MCSTPPSGPGGQGALLADLVARFDAAAAALSAGEISSRHAQEITRGITPALRAVPSADRVVESVRAGAIVLQVAKTGTVDDVRRVVARLRFIADPDGISQAAMDADDNQSLRFRKVGEMMIITAHLNHEAGAATMAVLEQKVDGWCSSGSLVPQDQPRPASPAPVTRSGLRAWARPCAVPTSSRRHGAR